MATAVLDTNVLNASGATVTVTTESLVTLYVDNKTGTSTIHRVMLEVSPDSGTTWVGTEVKVQGEGCTSMTVACTQVRAKVVREEGSTSTVDVWVLAT